MLRGCSEKRSDLSGKVVVVERVSDGRVAFSVVVAVVVGTSPVNRTVW